MVAVRYDIVRFVATALQFSRHPGRFGTAWVAGQTQALNPIGYLSTSLAVSAAASALASALLGTHDSGLWATLANAMLPYTYHVVLGLVCHGVLRLGGSIRPLRASVAIALFAGGGPGLVLTLAIYATMGLHLVLVGTSQGSVLSDVPLWSAPIFWILIYGPLMLLPATLAAGLRGVHGVTRVRAFVAMVTAMVITAAIFGVLHAMFDLEFNVPHLVLRFTHPRGFDIFF